MITATFTLQDHPRPGHTLIAEMHVVNDLMTRFTIARGVDGGSGGGIVLTRAEAEFVAMVFAILGVEPRRL